METAALLDDSVAHELAAHEPSYRELDRIEADVIAKLPPVDMPVKHHFLRDEQGNVIFYIREIFMPAGAVLTSRIHKTEHPYMITKGAVAVFTSDEGVKHLTAPHTGITKPGTKRLLAIKEDTIWFTFHHTDKSDVNEIAKDILFERTNELLTDEQRKRWVEVSK